MSPENVAADPRPLVEVISDQPITDPSEDRLGFAAYAAALAEVIDNPKTPTPLTISIDAPWGAGKTSLARLVEHNLRQWPRETGQLPHIVCWFNAWMHSDAEKLGPALAAAVSKALARKRRFRSRLLSPLPAAMLAPAERWHRRLALGSVAAIGALAAYIVVAVKAGNGHNLFEHGRVRTSSPLTIGVGVLAAVPVFFSLWARAFSVAQAAASFIDDPRSQAATGSMADVAEQFGKLVRAATRGRRRVVIFVDDLERCEQERAVEICQTAALLLGQPDVVTVLIGDLSALRTFANKRLTDEKAREDTYGCSFFEKIVQVEFALPPLDAADSKAMLFNAVERTCAPQPISEGAPFGGPTKQPGTQGSDSAFFNVVGDIPSRHMLVGGGLGLIFILVLILQLLRWDTAQEFFDTKLLTAGTATVFLTGFTLAISGLRSFQAMRMRRATANIDQTISDLGEPVGGAAWSVGETVEKATAALAGKPSTPKASRDLVAQRARRHLFDQLVGEVSKEIETFLPRLPRSIKRLANRQRLVVAVALSRDMMGGSPPLNAQHLAKWVLLLERWPDVATAIMRDPTLGARLEASTSDEMKQLLPSLAGNEEFFDFWHGTTKIGAVASRLATALPATSSEGSTEEVVSLP